MSRPLPKIAPFVLPVLAVLLGSLPPGPARAHGEHPEAPAAGVALDGLARLPDGSVQLPKASQRSMGLRTVVTVAGEAPRTVSLPGRVIADPNASGPVQAAQRGRVEAGPQGLPLPGQAVRRGQVLAWVRHQAEPLARGSQQAQIAELQAQRAVAEQRVQRLESLAGTVPRKDIEAARAELQGLVAREARLADSLDPREPLLAPVSGVVSQLRVSPGQVVEAREVLMEIVDPARLLVEAGTADPALAAQIAEAHGADQPGLRLRPLGHAGSLREGLLPLLFRPVSGAGTPPVALAVGQPLTVLAQTRERRPGIVLPAEAVVRSPANLPVVWVKAGAERFVPQPVQLQALDGRTVLITGGLAAHQRVVVQGAGLIAQVR